MTDGPDRNDGRSLWWMIPAAVASVLGVAAATIVRTRQRNGPAPGETIATQGPPPLAPLPTADRVVAGTTASPEGER